MNCFISLRINFLPKLNKINKQLIIFNSKSIQTRFKKKSSSTTVIFSNFLGSDSFKKGNLERKTKKRTAFYKLTCTSLSILGLLETIYLTVSKLNGTALACSDQNCSIVLSSVFSYFFGIPISSIGILLYFLTGLQIYKYYEKKVQIPKNDLYMFILTTTPLQLSFFSSYFVFVLEKILKVTCPWCYFSIFLSGLLLIISTITSIGDRNGEVKSTLFFLFSMTILVLIINSFNIIELQLY